MDEIVKATRHFIMRDVIFILSGGTVIGSTLHLFDKLPSPNDSWVLYGLLAGVGYFIAYAIQDMLCLTHLITTTHINKPCWFIRLIYKLYMHEKWQEIDINIDEIVQTFGDDDEARYEFERLVMFQLIGTAGGSCMLASGVLFFVRWAWYLEKFDFFVAIAGTLLGLSLIILSWLKGAQRAQFMSRIRK